jgi:hypothetical protein
MLHTAMLAMLLVTMPFEAQTLDGESARGELKAASAREVVLATDTGDVALPLEKLATLAPVDVKQSTISGGLEIRLIDGATLVAEDFRAKSGKATATLGPDSAVVVPTSAVRSARLVPITDPKLQKQWAEISEMRPAGDLLVVSKGGALDYLEGIVRSLDGETCDFELDGESIPVKREKITGLVYAATKKSELPESIGSLVLVGGSQLPLRSLTIADAKLAVETPAGFKLTLPLSDTQRFDFSGGKIAYLSDLEPENVQFTPLIGFAEPPQALLGYFNYRRDKGFNDTPLKLDGKEFRKGLSLASRTGLSYRLPDAFRLFRTTVGIDDTTRESGSVWLSIKGDGKTLWEGEVRGTEPAKQLELDVNGVRRIDILADYGEGLDVGDRLDLADAHVTK